MAKLTSNHKQATERTVIDVPFFGNIDNTHCYQAVIQMLAKHFFDENISQVELEPVTHKLPGMWI